MADLDVLVVDDDAGCADAVRLMLEQDGLGAVMVPSAKAALAQLEKQAFDMVITDVRMDGMNGLELLQQLKATVPEVPVLLMTAHEDTRTGVAAMRAGAADFLMKPLRREEVLGVVRKALLLSEPRRCAPPPLPRSSGLVGESAALREACDTLTKAARSSLAVLLAGEPGTGKEVAAHYVHASSPRAKGPFIALCCGAIPESLFEAELFGTGRGAFTTAVERPGSVDLAEGGTLFLDEVGELAPTVQAKLLRLLENQEYQRVGDARARKADVRIVSATNRPLEQMQREGTFRQDLFDRLNGVTVTLPPLREHAEDVPLLVKHFQPGAQFSAGALEVLSNHAWRGNVRELRNCLERLTVFSEDSKSISEADVRRELERNAGAAVAPRAADARAVDLAMIRDALERTGNNRAQAARLLGISRRTLYNRLAAMGG